MYGIVQALRFWESFFAALPRAKGFEELTGDGGSSNRLEARRTHCRTHPLGVCPGFCATCEKVM